MHRGFAAAGAGSAAIAVLAGAFGAHALRARVPLDLLTAFETAARYQMYHALGLLAVALLAERASPAAARAAGWLLVAGTTLFCGSLYALALTGLRALGAVTPFGGACFIAGWTALAAALVKGTR
jgi:uncharacterized membrane protein YgdD (TMEM256/DUF423 family)